MLGGKEEYSLHDREIIMNASGKEAGDEYMQMFHVQGEWRAQASEVDVEKCPFSIVWPIF